jgi:hypothetical protein
MPNPEHTEVPPVDPRIMFVLAMPAERREASVFQGFSTDALELSWVYERIAALPASLFEPAARLPELLGARICGMAGWRVIPMRLPFLRLQGPRPNSPLWIVFSADHETARGVADWQHRQSIKPLHVSLAGVAGAVGPNEISTARLRDHLLAQIDANPDANLAGLRPVVADWNDRKREKIDFEIKGHFALTPNQMTLAANGIEAGPIVPDWQGETPEAYRLAIAESVTQVDLLRSQALINESIRLVPPRPDLWLIAPSWFEDIKLRIAMTGAVGRDDRRAVEDLVRRIERQREFSQPMTEEQVARFDASSVAMQMHDTRKVETKLFAYAIGLAAAGTVARTWRIQPSVNMVRGRVSQLGENIRAEAGTSPAKVARLFEEVQAVLEDAVGDDAIAAIRDAEWGVKVVSDAPLEWLPINDLPLSLHTNVSRLSATPGDVLLRQLARHEPIRLAICDFSEILVVSAFRDGDRLDLIRQTLEHLEPTYAERLRVTFKRVETEHELITAINAFNGPLLIFDGHGSHPRDGLGHLIVGKDEVRIWNLRGRIKLPPIVVLSACDTQAAARSTGTVGNGLLHLGARTVLGTLLPIGAFEGALMIARLIGRLAGYLPIACNDLGRVVMWSEIVGGMLRMQFLFDLMIKLEQDGTLTSEQFHEILPVGSLWADRNGAQGLAYIEQALAERGIMEGGPFRSLVRRMVPLSDTIRYTQMGHPETILIGSVADLPEEVRGAFDDIVDHLAPTWEGKGFSPDAAVEYGDLLSGLPNSLLNSISATQGSRDK